MKAFPQPSETEVHEMLTSLLDRPVKLTKVSKCAATSIAVYSDGETERGLIGTDDRFRAYSSAALALIPVQVAESSISEPNPEICEIFFEVMNVLSGLYSTEGDRSVITGLHEKETAPKEVRRWFRRAEHSTAFEVEIEGYGTGVLRLAS